MERRAFEGIRLWETSLFDIVDGFQTFYRPTTVCRILAGLLGSARFNGSSQNYSTLLLEEETGLLYVGGRGALHALNTSNISTPSNLTVSATDQHVNCHKETANTRFHTFIFIS